MFFYIHKDTERRDSIPEEDSEQQRHLGQARQMKPIYEIDKQAAANSETEPTKTAKTEDDISSKTDDVSSKTDDNKGK